MSAPGAILSQGGTNVSGTYPSEDNSVVYFIWRFRGSLAGWASIIQNSNQPSNSPQWPFLFTCLIIFIPTCPLSGITLTTSPRSLTQALHWGHSSEFNPILHRRLWDLNRPFSKLPLLLSGRSRICTWLCLDFKDLTLNYYLIGNGDASMEEGGVRKAPKLYLFTE